MSRTTWPLLLSILGVAVLALPGLFPTPGRAEDTSPGTSPDAVTAFYVVRHAEKSGPGQEAPLTEEGFQRAADLRDVLREVPFTAVYSTRTLRTEQTARPVAEASSLEVRLMPEDVTSLIAAHRGGNVLLVGHSGSTDAHPHAVAAMVAKLSGEPVEEILETEYDNLFVVRISENESGAARREVELRSYGRP